MLWFIYRHYSISETEGHMYEFADLMSLEMGGQNLSQFLD